MMKQNNQINRHLKEENAMNKGNSTSKDNNTSKEYTMDEIDLALERMAKEMDEDFMRIGKELAELYRTICVAAASLPNMCLRGELMEVHNSDDGLMVVFHRDAAKAGRQNKDEDEADCHGDCCGYGDYGCDDHDDYDGHYGCDDDYDADEDFYDDYDEEEDLLYDGD